MIGRIVLYTSILLLSIYLGLLGLSILLHGIAVLERLFSH